MRLRTMRVLACITDVVGNTSDFFEGIECYRISRAFHRVYNALDDLHWNMGSPIRCSTVKQDTVEEEEV